MNEHPSVHAGVAIPPPVQRPSVGVLVDLELSEKAGGHVKCWQRLAEAAAGLGDRLDLTVYFLGDEERESPLSETVRYLTLPPRLGTRRFGFLAQGGGHTDLAPYHRRLAARLARHDVLHTTDVFAFGQTAKRIAQARHVPLVTSMHTDLPMFSEIYTAEIVRRTFGDGVLGRVILNDVKAGVRSRDSMRRKVDDMIHRSDHFLSANREDLRRAARIVGAKNVSRLRRGIDKARFDPVRRDREKLEATFGIPADCPVLLFIGRIDATKKALFAAQVARQLIDSGQDLRFLAIGEGAELPAISDLLGDKAVLPGFMRQEDLSWIYPSVDCFLFPSETETVGNVAIEAKASGLPVLLAKHPGLSQHVRREGQDGYLLSTSDPAAWYRTVRSLLEAPDLRRRVGAAARRTIEGDWPSWHDVVVKDLLPAWCQTVPRWQFSSARFPASPAALAR